MAAEDKYIKEISKYNQPGLYRLWKKHCEDKLDASQRNSGRLES
jgi:hypothetical protein